MVRFLTMTPAATTTSAVTMTSAATMTPVATTPAATMTAMKATSVRIFPTATASQTSTTSTKVCCHHSSLAAIWHVGLCSLQSRQAFDYLDCQLRAEVKCSSLLPPAMAFKGFCAIARPAMHAKHAASERIYCLLAAEPRPNHSSGCRNEAESFFWLGRIILLAAEPRPNHSSAHWMCFHPPLP